MYLLDRSKDKISRVEDDSFSNPIKQTVIANKHIEEKRQET